MCGLDGRYSSGTSCNKICYAWSRDYGTNRQALLLLYLLYSYDHSVSGMKEGTRHMTENVMTWLEVQIHVRSER